MALIKKSNVKKMFTPKDYDVLAQEYSDISKQVKALNDRKKALADKLKEGAELEGIKDDRGSFYIDGSNFVIGKVSKKSFSINEGKATPLLKEKGIYEECIDIIEVINTDKIQKAVDSELLTLDEVESITDIKTSYSVSVKEKEEMPEVEVSTLQAVARRKIGGK